MNSKLTLSFMGEQSPELVRTEFLSPRDPRAIIGLRGSHFISGTHPFKWGVAIHALSLFFARAAILSFSPSLEARPILAGTNPSPAASIDYALWQVRALWISDLFGVDAGGRNYLQKIITVLNSRQKKPRPVELYLNPLTLKPEHITLCLESKVLSSQTEICELCDRLERSWRPLQRALGTEGQSALCQAA